MCKTGLCKPKDNLCLGAVDGQTCFAHYQCDVGYGCLKGTQWPFASTCEKLGVDGSHCLMDEDCDIDHYCWYRTPEKALANEKECLKLYYAREFFEFGYMKDPK
jgi:hypothetical protein